MSVLYIKEQGSCVAKRGERIVVSKGANTLLEIPHCGIENIVVIGNVQITTQAMHVLMSEGVDVSFFTYSGKYCGRLAAGSSKNIFLRFAQYTLYQNTQERLCLARIIVANKIGNQISMIRAHRRQLKAKDYDAADDIKKMQECIATLDEKRSVSEIMGAEGFCSTIYFGVFGKFFNCDFEFHGRNRRPPKDPVNVLISLGYTFLTREVSSALEGESFEMYLGLLHGIRYGRKSLPLDIVEEFRQPVVDALVINLCNKRMMNRYDFEETEDEGIHLCEEGFVKFCWEFERWVNGTRGVNYRGIMKRQAARLKKAIMQKQEYVPYGMEEKNVSDQL